MIKILFDTIILLTVVSLFAGCGFTKFSTDVDVTDPEKPIIDVNIRQNEMSPSH